MQRPPTLALIFSLSCTALTCAAQAQQPEPVVVQVVSTGGHLQRQGEERSVYQERWEMNSRAELAASWWHWSSAQTTFEQGIATIGGRSYEEWMQRTDKNQSLWWDTIDPDIGFRIQTRMRVRQAECGGVGLWIHDGARMFKVYFCEGEVGVGYPVHEAAAVDTSVFHTYTIEGRADWIRIAVDGEVVVELQGADASMGAGTATLTFGNLGGAEGVGEWDWLSYDTRPQLVDPDQQNANQ